MCLNECEDWEIIRALSEVAGTPLAYDDIHEIRNRLGEIAPTLVQYDSLVETSADVAKVGAKALQAASSGSLTGGPLGLPIKDYYLTDAISRSSATMAKCSREFTHGIVDTQSAALESA
ncbi:hypothetical protein BC831DRAFT_435269 [Entophlyctis helioformis]|nr:hypothetical protein BC831DRAFT_435269 [Entophlyctis helioformis]